MSFKLTIRSGRFVCFTLPELSLFATLPPEFDLYLFVTLTALILKLDGGVRRNVDALAADLYLESFSPPLKRRPDGAAWRLSLSPRKTVRHQSLFPVPSVPPQHSRMA